jgi:hypothetical protein
LSNCGRLQGATLVTEATDVIAVLEPILGRGLDVPAQEPYPEVPLEADPAEDERTRITDLLADAGLDRRSGAAVADKPGDRAHSAPGTRNRRQARAARRRAWCRCYKMRYESYRIAE